ncbi:MAG: hypothetical protein FJZ59_02675 [Chlamydiae bacterium]|jgi:hypothetical protein|nr:hypothetical protein [Chlamydiota bacterium]
MQLNVNHNIEEKFTLPKIFGKCLGLEACDPSMMQIGSMQKKPKQDLNETEIIQYINENLPLFGNLEIDDRGFIFLSIVNEYIYELIPFLEAESIQPPPYFDGIFAKGAHISVALISEMHNTFNKELYQEEIPFSITGCYSLEPKNWRDIETVCFLTVASPKLSEIRQNLGLFPKMFDQEFHITIGVKKRFLSIHEILTHQNQSIIIKDIF